MSDLPIDQADRERLLHSGAQRIFVEAGAGSGKTHALTNRVVELIASGRASIGEVVAITFTEAAASELRGRIRYTLELEAAQHGPRASLCKSALERFGQTYIGTIHGWSQRLLRDHFLAAGLSPAFEVLDSTESILELDASWSSFASQYLASSQVDPSVEALLNTANVFGVEMRHLRTLHNAMSDRWERARRYATPVEFRLPKVDTSLVAADARELINMRQSIDVSGSDTMAPYIDNRITPWLASLSVVEAGDDLSALRWLQALKPKTGKIGNKSTWGSNIEVARDLCASLASGIESQLARVRPGVIDGLLALVSAHVVDRGQQRRKNGRLTFHDLLVLTSDMFSAHPDVVSAVKRTTRFVFVDEYQDTDPLQASIIDRLGEGSDSASIFTVGDPRQSIYRFRGADLEQFHTSKEAANESIALRMNFRSTQTVVDWITSVSEALAGVFADESNRLSASRTHDVRLGTVELFGTRAADGVRAPEVRRTEAQEVAARIKTVVSDGLAVHDAGELRPVRYSDIAILMPTRTTLAATTRALLEQSIPFRVEARSLVWATQEVRDVVAILSSINDADDSISLIAALTSSALACSDTDLQQWAQGGGRWDYRKQDPEGLQGTAVSKAFDWLRQLHYVRWRYSVAHLTSIVIEQCRMYELAYLQDRQREPWQRLRFIEDKAHRWLSGDGDGTLSGFIAWARVQIDNDAGNLESIIPETDDDAVRLMTIHASKGLEFPVVFVTGINSKRGNTASVVLRWVEDQCVVRVGNKEIGWGTPDFAEHLESEDTADAHESNRQLYVAMTRAKDHLFVSLHRSARSHQTMAEALENAAGGLQGTIAESASWSDEQAADDGVVVRPALSAEQWAKQRNAATSAARKPIAISASAANKEVAGEPETPLDGPSRQERMDFGTLVHNVLELVIVDYSSERTTALIKALCEERGLSHRFDDAVRATQLALDSKPVKAALKADVMRREVGVSVPFAGDHTSGKYVHGTIDLCYLEDGQWHIVDYKTDELRDVSSADRLIQHYQWQLLVYAEALANATAIPVATASLLLIDPNRGEATTRTICPDAKKRSQLMEQLGALFN